MAVALVVAAAAAERVVVQLGPRSWYTASTPVIVLAALIGGPLVGVAAGVSTQIIQPESVWRRQAAEGGVASLQGLAAGIVGLALLPGDSADMIRAAAAGMAVAILVNGVGRFLIMLERHPALLLELWPLGLRVDLLEGVLVVPVLSVLLMAEGTSPFLVVITVFSLLTALLIAQRSRASTAAELAAEQVNARRDQLTGAANRRAFEEAMTAEHSRVVRGAVPAGLFVVDLDRFKSVNDRFGHAVGDEVLIEVVRRLTEGLRPSDVVARWGGEEIAVLAPGRQGTAPARAVRRADPHADPGAPGRNVDDGVAGDGLRRRHPARRLHPAGRGIRPRRQRALRRQAHARCDGDHAAAEADAAARDRLSASATPTQDARCDVSPVSAVITPSPTKTDPETYR